MKYLKTFENKKLDKIIDLIKSKVVEWTWEDEDNDLSDCPFEEEFAIIHQKDYIDDIHSNNEFSNIDLDEFIQIYTNLLEASRDIIISSLKRNPNLYSEWKDVIDSYDYYLNIPEYIKTASKYNL